MEYIKDGFTTHPGMLTLSSHSSSEVYTPIFIFTNFPMTYVQETEKEASVVKFQHSYTLILVMLKYPNGVRTIN